MNDSRPKGFPRIGGLALGIALLMAPPAKASDLTIQLRDASGTTPVAARVQVQDLLGWHFAQPDPVLLTRISASSGPYVHAEDAITVPIFDGPITVRAVIGLTGVPVEWNGWVVGDSVVTLPLTHWVDPPAEGWWGGDGHAHSEHTQSGTSVYPPATPAQVALAARAEALEFLALLDNEAGHPGGDVVPSQPGVALVWGEEYRSAFWGHIVVLGLDSLLLTDGIPGCCGATFDAAPTLHHRLQQDPPPLVWMAHPHTTDDPFSSVVWPGVGYGRERAAIALTPSLHGIAVASGTNGPGTRWAVQEYLDALRSGARWSAIAEGDRVFDRHAMPPLGELRTFARVDPIHPVGSSSGAADWVNSVVNGQTFATTGPFLHQFDVDEVELGGTLTVSPATSVDVHFVVSSWAPLTTATLHGARGPLWTGSWPTGTTLIDEVVSLPIPHDEFLVLEVSGPPVDWTTHPEGPRLMTSPLWIDAGAPWPVPVEAARRGVEDLEYFWERSLVDRGYDTPVDSMQVAGYILGAAAQLEAAADDPPAPFQLVAPLEDSELPSTVANFSWTQSVSYDGEAVFYRVALSTDPVLNNPTWSPPVAGTSYSWPGLGAGQEYWWRVEAIEAGEAPTWATQGPWRFEVSPTPTAVETVERLRVGHPRWQAGSVRFGLELPSAARVSVYWYDLRGRRVAMRSHEVLDRGTHELRWNARDDRGQRVAASAYLAVIDVAGERRVLRATVPAR